MLVVKYGGNAMGDRPDEFIAECAELARAGEKLVLVHGGGPQIDAALKERGIPERRIAGLRVTDSATLEVTERVLTASVNKALVRSFLMLGIQAVGVSGQDAALIVARKLPPLLATADGEEQSLGYVGEVERIQPQLLHVLLDAGYLPVIAPLGVSADGTERYNLNADTAAGAIAGALGADPYVVVTDVPRVRSNPRDAASGIDHMTLAKAREYLAAGSFDGGMLPKMLAIFTALESGARRAVVAGGVNALHKALRGDGTVITH
jgi:acetylglutamate kinase